jgi:hypothetical protein
MAIANYFYNSTTRKYVALFGTYFNQLTVERIDNNQVLQQRMIVPISYAPYQKILARIQQAPDLNTTKSAINLPRMSFEITNMQYDGERKISPITKIRKTVVDEALGGRKFVYAGAPYNLDFSLYIMAKYQEDAVKLLEQIIPFFQPDFTSTVRLIPGIEPIDIPLILNSISMDEIYEGAFDERQSILYTLTFTMKAWYFGPEKQKSIIKFVDVRYATDTASNSLFEENYTVQPGMTANNEPTTDQDLSIDYSLIDFDDNWDYAEKVTNTFESVEPFVDEIIPGDDPVDLETSSLTNIDLEDGFGLEDIDT